MILNDAPQLNEIKDIYLRKEIRGRNEKEKLEKKIDWLIKGDFLSDEGNKFRIGGILLILAQFQARMEGY